MASAKLQAALAASRSPRKSTAELPANKISRRQVEFIVVDSQRLSSGFITEIKDTKNESLKIFHSLSNCGSTGLDMKGGRLHSLTSMVAQTRLCTFCSWVNSFRR